MTRDHSNVSSGYQGAPAVAPSIQQIEQSDVDNGKQQHPMRNRSKKVLHTDRTDNELKTLKTNESKKVIQVRNGAIFKS
jgi:hypothetical protein